MSRITRRDFLKQAALGLGVATVLPAVNIKGESPSENILSEDVFIQGLVVDVDLASQVFVSEDDQRRFIVRVMPDTRLWKGKITTLDEVQLGDFLYGFGKPMDDGTIAAQKLWFNIISFYAKVDAIVERVPGRTKFHAVNASKGETENHPRFTVVKDLDTIINSDGASSSYEPTEGNFIQVIGLAMRDGSFKATRIWVFG
jgi:hypothetical protein